MKTVVNENPTETEKEMWFKSGLYRVYEEDVLIYYREINLPINKCVFPTQVSVTDYDLKHGKSVLIDLYCKKVLFSGWFDFSECEIIEKRLQELVDLNKW